MSQEKTIQDDKSPLDNYNVQGLTKGSTDGSTDDSSEDSTAHLIKQPRSVSSDSAVQNGVCSDLATGDAEKGPTSERDDVLPKTCDPVCTKPCVVYILTGVAVVLSLATLGVTIAVALQPKQQGFRKLLVPDTCVPCIKLILNPYNPSASDPVLDKLDKRVVNGVQMCCAGNAEQLSAMLECILRDQETRPVPAPPSSESTLKFVPASAHKKLLPPKNKPSDDHFFMTLDPDFCDSSEHAHGVNVTNTSIIIKYTGLYYVYTNIHFRWNTSTDWSLNTQSLFQYVERHSPNSPANTGLLLQNSHTVCPNSSTQEETAFTGGVFYLRKEDMLHVCVSDLAAHSQISGISTFGVIMLASGDRQQDKETGSA